MSHAAIAAVLRLEGVSAGERLAAFSLASFANREHRAWPGTPVAAARAGLAAASTSRPATHSPATGWLRSIARRRARALSGRLAAVRRGGPVVRPRGQPGSGGGGPSATAGHAGQRACCWPRWPPSLISTATWPNCLRRRSRRRRGWPTAPIAGPEPPCWTPASCCWPPPAAAARAPTTGRSPTQARSTPGRRVRSAAAGAWARDATAAREHAAAGVRRRGSARPLVEAATGERKGPGLSGDSAENPGQNRTVSRVKGPELSGVSTVNPGQNRTVCGETPPQTPPETPPPNARTGREPQNPRIRNNPPNPPEGGSANSSQSSGPHHPPGPTTPADRDRRPGRDPVTAPLQPRRSRRLATDPRRPGVRRRRIDVRDLARGSQLIASMTAGRCCSPAPRQPAGGSPAATPSCSSASEPLRPRRPAGHRSRTATPRRPHRRRRQDTRRQRTPPPPPGGRMTITTPTHTDVQTDTRVDRRVDDRKDTNPAPSQQRRL